MPPLKRVTMIYLLKPCLIADFEKAYVCCRLLLTCAYDHRFVCAIFTGVLGFPKAILRKHAMAPVRVGLILTHRHSACAIVACTHIAIMTPMPF